MLHRRDLAAAAREVATAPALSLAAVRVIALEKT